MNILNINQTDTLLGGSDIYWKELTKLLTSKGHKVVEFSSSKSDPRLPKEINLSKPNVFSAQKFFYNYEAKRKLDELLKTQKIDIAHVNIFYGKLTVSILDVLKQHNIPIVHTSHEYKLVCPTYTMFSNGEVCNKCKNNKFYNCVINRCNNHSLFRSVISTVEQYFSLYKHMTNSFDKIICVSEFQRNQMLSMGLPEDKSVVVHNFVNTSNKVKKYNPKHLLYFGRVEEVKGIQVLLDALVYLRNEYNMNPLLMIAGDGSDLIKYKNFVNENNLNNVSFLGHCSKRELRNLIDECICSVVPSLWYETFGLTVTETMDRGRPVIISKIGGMSEIITDLENGLCIEPGNYVELADKIKMLVEDISLSENLGMKARFSVIKNFSSQAHYEKLNSIYEELTQNDSTAKSSVY